MPNIRRFLDLSTAHLTEEDKQWLKREAGDSSCFEGCYGWFSHCHEDPDDSGNVVPDDNRPANLTAIFAYALKHGCDYVLFDADAEQNDDLPTFDADGKPPLEDQFVQFTGDRGETVQQARS